MPQRIPSDVIALRDDAGLKSLSNVERDFILSCAFRTPRPIRTDGRLWNQPRQQQLQLQRWENGASAVVQWGSGTRVTCTVTGSLIPPSVDRPSEGQLALSVDISPASSTSMRAAAPFTTVGGTGGSGKSLSPSTDQKLISNRILRCLERILIIGSALDTEALCVVTSAWVWKLQVSVTILDCGGNLLDASVLSCLAALRHYRKPHAQVNNDGEQSSPPILISSDTKEATPLPLHHTPLSISFALLNNDDGVQKQTSTGTSTTVALLDPTDREELVMAGTLTIAMNVHLEICLLDYGGGCELKPSSLRDCYKTAEIVIAEQCKTLDNALQEADLRAIDEQLQRLKRQRYPSELPPLPTSTDDDDIPNVPFYQSVGAADTGMDGASDDADAAAIAAEEAYRKQALDYNLGHVASKVREDRKEKGSPQKKASSLLAAMLQSVQGVDETKDKSATQSATPEPMGSSTVSQKGASKSKPKPGSTELAQPKAESKRQAKNVVRDEDSDEEATTMQLQSEFASVEVTEKSKTNKEESKLQVRKQEKDVEMDDDDDDVDDLAMAIKKKKKGRKSKK